MVHRQLVSRQSLSTAIETFVNTNRVLLLCLIGVRVDVDLQFIEEFKDAVYGEQVLLRW